MEFVAAAAGALSPAEAFAQLLPLVEPALREEPASLADQQARPEPCGMTALRHTALQAQPVGTSPFFGEVSRFRALPCPVSCLSVCSFSVMQRAEDFRS